MRRRDAIAGICAAGLAIRGARGQTGSRRKVALFAGSLMGDNLQTFKHELQRLGWREGYNLELIAFIGTNDPSRIERQSKDIVDLQPDVIFALSSAALAPLLKATRTIPIVFIQVGDPVGRGFVASLAHPGGNATGVMNFESTIGGKWLEVLKEIAPDVTRVAVVAQPETTAFASLYASVETHSSSFRVRPFANPVHSSTDIEKALVSVSGEPGGGLIVLPDTFAVQHRKEIISLAARLHLPAVYPFRLFTTAGGLISYGNDVTDMFRQAASYLDHILRGASPADLPVQAPTKYQLVINMKTARELGLTVPPALLATADEVIE